MKFISIAALALVLSIQSLALPWGGEVTRVLDGDTLAVLRDDSGLAVRVRLYGVDCPEGGQSHGAEAARFMEQFILRRRVGIVDMGLDRYGRAVGGVIILASGDSLQELLLTEGLAWVYPQYCKDCRQWKDLEMKARLEKKGLWRDENPLPPWEWRKQKKTGKGKNTGQPAKKLLSGGKQ